MFLHVLSAYIKDQVSINNLTILINSDTTVSVSVICKPYV